MKEEWKRLTNSWSKLAGKGTKEESDQKLLQSLLGDAAADLDLFDVPQLAFVIRTCRTARTLSEAGRQLFAQSRKTKQKPNDADRLRKYLARFNLSWEQIQESYTRNYPDA